MVRNCPAVFAVPTALSTHTYLSLQHCGLVHPNIYPIYDLLEFVKGPVLQNENCGISVTQAHSRISQMSFSEGPVMMVYQRP
ncbi:small conductance calcium-activated potassium channel protein 2 [Cricetulus griseus]|uniref:Small conductance calcium-activated potassium channel protein 2 n=1 Tax=Cricetulus griseus TaxID=10029 RepID=A0A061IH62_CRIGR|nr:small conductance calcium-activated potassium channel protein 2 [Cricetulus griseus]